MGAARVRLVWIAAGLVVACGAFNEASETPAAPDASADAPGDAPASDDAASPDGTIPKADAGDASDAADAGPRFCDGVGASFCEDFEAPQRVNPGWSSAGSVAQLGGMIIEAKHPTNGTKSLHVTTAASTTTLSGRNTREVRIAALSKVHIELDLHVAETTYDNRLVVLAVYFGTSSTEKLNVELNVFSSHTLGVTYTRPTGPEDFGSGTAFTLGQTHHVTFDVDVFGTGTGAISYRVGNGVMTAHPVTRVGTPTGPLRVLLGAHRYAPNTSSPAFALHYDNVTIDVSQ